MTNLIRFILAELDSLIVHDLKIIYDKENTTDQQFPRSFSIHFNITELNDSSTFSFKRRATNDPGSIVMDSYDIYFLNGENQFTKYEHLKTPRVKRFCF